MRLIVNGYELDLSGTEKIATTYQASPVAGVPVAAGFFTVEFKLPKTATNKKAFGIPDVLPIGSNIPFELLPAQYEQGGIDMRIDAAMLVSVGETINVRMYGGCTTLIQALGNKSIQDIDLSDYDHVRNYTNIAAKLQATDGYVYPLIDYLDDITDNKINAESMYPAFFLHTLFDKMLADIGWTLNGDLSADDDFNSILIPFASKQGEYTTDYINSLKSKWYNLSAQSFPGGIEFRFPLFLLGDATDDFNLVYPDPFPMYHALIRADYEFDLRVEITGTPTTNVTIVVLRVPLAFPISVGDTFDVYNSLYYNLQQVASYNVTGTDFGTGTAIIEETFTTTLNKGERLFALIISPASSAAFTIQEGSSTTFIEVTDVTNYGIFLNDTWQIAPNLPNIKQVDILRYISQSFSLILTPDNEAKQLRATKFKSVANNFERDDWSEKIDLSEQPEIQYPSDLAQLNNFKYLDDENFVKPEGADYHFSISNRNLIPEKDIYVAPFGATVPVEKFTDNLLIPRIDILSNQLKPRVLVYKAVTVTHAIHIHVSGSSSGSHANVCVPFFIQESESFNLGFGQNLLSKNGVERMAVMTRPRILSALFKLSPADINTLDFDKPVWIERFNSNFYKMLVEQYRDGESTKCKLLEING